jgi:hypothetical protein
MLWQMLSSFHLYYVGQSGGTLYFKNRTFSFSQSP